MNLWEIKAPKSSGGVNQSLRRRICVFVFCIEKKKEREYCLWHQWAYFRALVEILSRLMVFPGDWYRELTARMQVDIRVWGLTLASQGKTPSVEGRINSSKIFLPGELYRQEKPSRLQFNMAGTEWDMTSWNLACNTIQLYWNDYQQGFINHTFCSGFHFQQVEIEHSPPYTGSRCFISKDIIVIVMKRDVEGWKKLTDNLESFKQQTTFTKF